MFVRGRRPRCSCRFTLAVALGLYRLVTVVALGVTPWPMLGASRAPLADAAAGVLGPAGRSLVAAAALLTTAATGNASGW